MSYNFRGYSQYLQHVPGPASQRPLRVGEPILTGYGWGIITDIKAPNGGSVGDQGPKGVIISVLFKGAKSSVDIPLAGIAFQSNFTGQTPLDSPLQ